MKKKIVLVLLSLILGLSAQMTQIGVASDNIKPLDLAKFRADDILTDRVIQGIKLYDNIYIWSKNIDDSEAFPELGFYDQFTMDYFSLGRPEDGYLDQDFGVFNSFIGFDEESYELLVGFTSTNNVDDRIYRVSFFTNINNPVWEHVLTLPGNFDAEYYNGNFYISATNGEPQNNIYRIDKNEGLLEAVKIIETQGSSAGFGIFNGNFYYATADFVNPNALYQFKSEDIIALSEDDYLTIPDNGVKLTDLTAGAYDTDVDEAGNIIFNINDFVNGSKIVVWTPNVTPNYNEIAVGYSSNYNWFGLLDVYGAMTKTTCGAGPRLFGVLCNDAGDFGLTHLPYYWAEDLLTNSFETLPIPDGELYWNGSDESGYFREGEADFINYYNTDWSSWSGFAYSKANDTETPGYENMYSIYHGSGAYGSDIFGIAYGSAELKFAQSQGDYNTDYYKVYGFYVTNTTYTALEMKNGSGFSKKFGGETGNDPDWFKLTVTANYASGSSETKVVYLADYRFEDNAKDYILDDWLWVDLNEFSDDISSLSFSLSSSDNGDYGMNTPAYFALDNLVYGYTGTVGIEEDLNEKSLHLAQNYPNPFNPTTNIKFTLAQEQNIQLNIFNSNGQLVKKLANGNYKAGSYSLEFKAENLNSGIYYYQLKAKNSTLTKKMIMVK